MPDLLSLFHPGISPKTIFEPTKFDFGKPVKFPAISLKVQKNGILRSTPDGGWTIHGMPLLCQTDNAINEPLDKLIATVPPSHYPMKRNEKDEPILNNGVPVRYSALEMRENAKGYGCYDTSIVTVLITALANRHSSIKLINRTKAFNEIKTTDAGTPKEVSKEINQLVQQYFYAFKGGIDRNRKKEGYAVANITQPLYFHEAVADIGNGKIVEQCNPYVYGDCGIATLNDGSASAFRTFQPFSPGQLTNEVIIDLMLSGVVPMIAYNRHIPTWVYPAARPPKGQRAFTGYTFVFNSHHKVVFNGFNKNKAFPLRIYDVGNGQVYNVRISTDLNELAFLHGNGHPAFHGSFTGKPFLIYEGTETIVGNSVLFIDHYDGLRIKNNSLERVSVLSDPITASSGRPVKPVKPTI